MTVNFSDDEVILTFGGAEVRICQEFAVPMAKDILNYFEEGEDE